MQIKDRIFGANIDKKVIEKIKALGGGGLSGNEGDVLSERKPTFEKYLGEKTPFARMWTAVSLHYHEDPVYGELHGKAKYTTVSNPHYSSNTSKVSFSPLMNVRSTIKDILKEEVNMELEKRVYIVGNNQYNMISS